MKNIVKTEGVLYALDCTRTYLYTRVWWCKIRGPYEKAQIAKPAQQTLLCTTLKTGMEYRQFYTCNLISIISTISKHSLGDS